MADSDFDLDTSTQQAWDAFESRLDEVLSMMDASSDLTITAVRSDKEVAPGPSIVYSAMTPGLVKATVHAEPSPQLIDLGWQAGDDGLTSTVDQENTSELARRSVRTFAEALDVLHPVFLEPDQLAEVFLPEKAHPGPTVTKDTITVFVPENREDLENYLEIELEKHLKRPPLRTARGDLAVRSGSTVVFVRSTPDCKEVVLFAPLVHDVAGRSRAAEVLNDLNAEARFCRFSLHRDRVYAQISVYAQPLVTAHLKQALEDLTVLADEIDDELATRLSGRTTYPS